jgi:hypothetical protein
VTGRDRRDFRAAVQEKRGREGEPANGWIYREQGQLHYIEHLLPLSV